LVHARYAPHSVLRVNQITALTGFYDAGARAARPNLARASVQA
jgi:hypothetical protein